MLKTPANIFTKQDSMRFDNIIFTFAGLVLVRRSRLDAWEKTLRKSRKMQLHNKLLAFVDLALVSRKRWDKAAKAQQTKKFSESLLALAPTKFFGMPDHPARIALVVTTADLEALPDFLAAFPHCRLEYVAFADCCAEQPKYVRIPDVINGFRAAPVAGDIAKLQKQPDLERVLYAASIRGEALRHAMTALALPGGLFYVAGLPPAPATWSPYYWATWHAQLDETANLLACDASRHVLVARVKALCSGNRTYHAFSSYARGLHPKVLLRPGDIVLDAHRAPVPPYSVFAGRAGADGRVLLTAPAFIASECPATGQNSPDAEETVPAPVTTLPARLARFRVDASLEELAAGPAEPVTTLDALLAEHAIARLDFISLDLGGGELAALRGAEKILRERKPNLAVAVYHDSTDVMTIPAYIAKLGLGYKLYLGHHSLTDEGTILYATTRPKR